MTPLPTVALREALEALVGGVEQFCNEPGGPGISGYLGARLQDARNALSQSSETSIDKARCRLCEQTWKRKESQFPTPPPYGCAAQGHDRHEWDATSIDVEGVERAKQAGMAAAQRLIDQCEYHGQPLPTESELIEEAALAAAWAALHRSPELDAPRDVLTQAGEALALAFSVMGDELRRERSIVLEASCAVSRELKSAALRDGQ